MNTPSLEIMQQLSPVQEICDRCADLGLPAVIPAGTQFYAFVSPDKTLNCCAAHFAKLAKEAQG
jgi:hypothetical protein